MYSSDSFFTLSVPGQVGLAILSLMLTLAMVWVARVVTRRRAVWARLLITLLLFLAFDWLSPQIYYAYYRAIIPGLPLQWVIAGMPDVPRSIGVLPFQAEQSLSAHGRAVLGWLMVLFVLWRR